MSPFDFQPRCDFCGRFVQPGTPGTSWVNVPHCPPMSQGDERVRCASCTRNRGPALCSPSYRRDLCCGVIGANKGPQR